MSSVFARFVLCEAILSNKLPGRIIVIPAQPDTARWPFADVAKLADIDLQLFDGAAQGITVHAQLSGGAALIALVLLKHGSDEALLKLAHRLGVKNVAAVHVLYERQKLIFHKYLFSGALQPSAATRLLCPRMVCLLRLAHVI